MPPKKGTKRKQQAEEPEKSVETETTEPTTTTTATTSSKKGSTAKAKKEATTKASSSSTRGRGRPSKASKTEEKTEATATEEGEREEIPTDEEEQQQQQQQQQQASSEPMAETIMPSSSSSSSSSTTLSSSSGIPFATGPIGRIDTDESGIGLLKRILYVIPDPPAEAIGTTVSEFRTEVAKRYSIDSTAVRIFDPRYGRPGIELTEEGYGNKSISTYLGTELRVFISETNGSVKEWMFWFDDGTHRTGYSQFAHISMEPPELATYMSKPSLVDIELSKRTGLSMATVPIAGEEGLNPALIVATATNARSQPDITIIGGDNVQIEPQIDTTKQSIDTMQTLGASGEETSEKPKRNTRSTHKDSPATAADVHNTRSHDKNKIEVGFIEKDVAKFHQQHQSTGEHEEGSGTTLSSSSSSSHHHGGGRR